MNPLGADGFSFSLPCRNLQVSQMRSFSLKCQKHFFNPALMYGHLSVIVSTVASLSAVNVSVISGMKFPFKGSPHAFNFNSCTSEFCFSFKKRNMVPPTTLQSLSRHCRSLYTNSWCCIKPAFFSEVRAHGLLFLIWLMKQVSFYRGLFFFLRQSSETYASLQGQQSSCRTKHDRASQTEHEKNRFYQIW